MLKKFLAVAALVGAVLTAGASTASAAGQACYDAQVHVNGEQVVAEASCLELP